MVVSESTAAELENVGFSRNQFSFVYNCVDHTKYKQTGVEKSEVPLIGFLGRLKKYKSIEHAIRAFAIVKREIPNAEFLIVGDGDYRAELEKVVRETQLQQSIRFAGFVSESEKVRLLETMHVVVQPSSKEGWGLTVLEANACGIPCVASDVQGLREAVVDGETGLLFEYGNVQQFAEKIILLLKNETLRSQMERNAVEWAKKFDWEKSADGAIEMMQRTIAESK